MSDEDLIRMHVNRPQRTPDDQPLPPPEEWNRGSTYQMLLGACRKIETESEADYERTA